MVVTLTLAYKTSGDMKSATTPSGKTLTYKFDAFGNRTAEFEDGDLKAAYLYAPGISGPVAKVDESGAEEARFIYATRSHVPDFMVQRSTTYRMITDQLGSIRQVVNASTGAVAQEITYDAFGEVLSDTSPGFQPFGFAGGLYEPETGLTHFGAREYDAGLGRWTSSDPIGLLGRDTNLYGYVLQDPVNFFDPNGLFLKKAWNWTKDHLDEIESVVMTTTTIVAAGACIAVTAGTCGLILAGTLVAKTGFNAAHYARGDYGEVGFVKRLAFDAASTALLGGPGIAAKKAFEYAAKQGLTKSVGEDILQFYLFGLPGLQLGLFEGNAAELLLAGGLQCRSPEAR